MKIGIAHDSDAMARLLAEAVRHEPGWSAVWRADRSLAAPERCRAYPPDVLLLQCTPEVADLTRRIMRDTPCAIVLLTATRHVDTARVFGALAAGALNVVAEPAVDGQGRLAGIDAVVRALRTAGALRATVAPAPESEPLPAERPLPPLVVIGASTGGPTALAQVLAPIPREFAAAIVVVQHVAAEFSGDLLAWIGGRTHLPVRAASHGDLPARGVVLMAAGADDLWLERGLRLTYRRPRLDSFYHPSVDVFFESVASGWPTPGAAVLLTGIGRDGAQGLLALRRAGWMTIAQDAHSAVVDGMPRAARELGAADHVLPLAQIARLVRQFGEGAVRGEVRP
jgi:two-component system response regulator WspF